MSPRKTAEAPSATRSTYRYHYLSDLSFTYEGYGEWVHPKLPNFSAEGMFLHTPLTLPEGAVIQMSFRLNRLNREVTTRGEVRYCLPGVGVGVEFIGIDAESKIALQEELGIDE